MTELEADKILDTIEPDGSLHGDDWVEVCYRRHKVRELIAALSAATEPDMRDAYVGAREDLQIWKRRALEAEAALRNAAATGGQESEAQAVAIVDAIEVDPSKRTLKSLSYERLQSIPAGTKLYTAPPSAIAIESAAKRQAAEVCRMWNTTPGSKLAKEILSTIPQDGITALEEFGMKLLQEAHKHVRAWKYEGGPDNFRAIVRSLLGEKK